MNFSNRFQNSSDPIENFLNVCDSQLEAHMDVKDYGPFELTNAVRPAMDLKIKPAEGYRHDVYLDEESGSKVPVVMAAVSKNRLFETFMQLIEKLGTSVDVVLESSHNQSGGQHQDYYREHIDMSVLTSVLWDFEDLLLNDGCTGIAVLNPNTPQEVQFEEHKLLIVYGSPLEQYEFVLDRNGVSEKQSMKFITEAEHIHSSSDHYYEQFQKLRTDLGLDGSPLEGDYEGGEFYGEDGDHGEDGTLFS